MVRLGGQTKHIYPTSCSNITLHSSRNRNSIGPYVHFGTYCDPLNRHWY